MSTDEILQKLIAKVEEGQEESCLKNRHVMTKIKGLTELLCEDMAGMKMTIHSVETLLETTKRELKEVKLVAMEISEWTSAANSGALATLLMHIAWKLLWFSSLDFGRHSSRGLFRRKVAYTETDHFNRQRFVIERAE
jgi:hypothetical protein